mmetsp:Transcript_30761/g.69945  ORF Transcript_30761/g.69945 Transcript_30761/m.69945 type:complete len:535 (+) Transcript_30761:629-2233(+)
MAGALHEGPRARHDVQAALQPRSAGNRTMGTQPLEGEWLRLGRILRTFGGGQTRQGTEATTRKGQHGRMATIRRPAKDVVRLEQGRPHDVPELPGDWSRSHEGRRRLCWGHQCARCCALRKLCGSQVLCLELLHEFGELGKHLSKVAGRPVQAAAVGRCQAAVRALAVVSTARDLHGTAVRRGAPVPAAVRTVLTGTHGLLLASVVRNDALEQLVAIRDGLIAEVDHRRAPHAHLLVTDPRGLTRGLEQRLGAHHALDARNDHHVEPLQGNGQRGHAHELPWEVWGPLASEVLEWRSASVGTVAVPGGLPVTDLGTGLHVSEAIVDFREEAAKVAKVFFDILDVSGASLLAWSEVALGCARGAVVVGFALGVVHADKARRGTPGTRGVAGGILVEHVHLPACGLVLVVELVKLPLAPLGHLCPDVLVKPPTEEPVDAIALVVERLRRCGLGLGGRGGAAALLAAATACSPDPATRALQFLHLVAEVVNAWLELLWRRNEPERPRERCGHPPVLGPPLLGRLVLRVGLTWEAGPR